MRYNKLILPIALALIILPLALVADTAAGQPNAQGFGIVLSDGSLIKGALSFTMNIDTQYGRLTVPSTNFVSAHFNSSDGWADIRTVGTQLHLQYKPDSGRLTVTTDTGPFSVDLSRVVSIDTLYPQPQIAASQPVPNPSDQASLADIYSQPATLMDLAPYEYGSPAPYYWPSYYPLEPYGLADDYPYGYAYGCGFGSPFCWWPGCGFGFAGISNFDRFGHLGRFDRFGEFGGGFRHDSGVADNRFGAGVAARQFNGVAGAGPAISGRTFASPSFRSAAAPSFRSAGTFSRGGFSGRSFSSGGFSGRSFSRGGFSGGGFSHGGFGGGHGGGGHGR